MSLGLGDARRAAGRWRRRARTALRRRRLDRHYRARRRRPIDPDLALFAAYWYRGYACNPRAIYEKARELVPSLRGVWVVRRRDAAAMPEGVEYVVSGTRDYYDLIARATYFVNNVNWPDHLVKRDRTVHVMTHHGTPLKRMGVDLRDTPTAAERTNFEGLLRRCARWDYSVSANPFSTEVWRRAYPVEFEDLEVGYPRNDVLATAGPADVAAARAALDLPDGRQVVLYAPTRREYEPGGGPVLDVAALAAALGDGYIVLARSHYLDGSAYAAAGVRDVGSHPSVEELCLAADVLVTDYSSIMFDYAVLDRPIVIHAPDWAVYREKRGTYFDLLAESPGTVATADEGVAEALLEGRAHGEDAARARAAFRARFCALEDGGAAERVVRRVWLGERDAADTAAASLAR
jgi:CDP-glycerol glycerophosphotransferase